jgi:predicted dehydrogenase
MTKIGIIGGGMWAKTHIKCIREEGRGEVAWVCDAAEKVARDVQKEFGVPRVSTRHGDLLADPAVEGVIVATPTFTHPALALDVLRAGKHLLLEKPMAMNAADAAALDAEAARRPSQIALEASCRFTRVEPKFAFVRDLVASGRLGEVYHVDFRDLKTTTYIEYNPSAAGWAGRRATAGGGPTFDWGEYDLSFLLGVLGDTPQLKSLHGFVRRVARSPQATGGPDSDVEQHGVALLDFGGGLTIHYERGGGAYGDQPGRVRIHGTRGGLELSYYPWDEAAVTLFREDASGRIVAESLPVPVARRFENANTPVVAHFVDCIRGLAAPSMPFALARKHLDIVLRLSAVA